MCEAERELRKYSLMVRRVLKKYPDAYMALLKAEREEIENSRRL